MSLLTVVGAPASTHFLDASSIGSINNIVYVDQIGREENFTPPTMNADARSVCGS